MKRTIKPKRVRTKFPKKKSDYELLSDFILGEPKPKRKRMRKQPIIKNLICSEAKRCWYKGPCPHRQLHSESKTCKQNFCSLMKISVCCEPQKEK